MQKSRAVCSTFCFPVLLEGHSAGPFLSPAKGSWKLAASLTLPEYKNSSACIPVVGWQNLSAGSTEKMSAPDTEWCSFYFGRHLAASVQPSDSFRAGLQRQNMTSAAARDENKRKVRIKYCIFPEKMQHRSSSIQKVHRPWFQV